MESLESAERMKKDLEDRLTGAYREVNIVFVVCVCVCGGGGGGGVYSPWSYQDRGPWLQYSKTCLMQKPWARRKWPYYGGGHLVQLILAALFPIRKRTLASLQCHVFDYNFYRAPHGKHHIAS